MVHYVPRSLFPHSETPNCLTGSNWTPDPTHSHYPTHQLTTHPRETPAKPSPPFFATFSPEHPSNSCDKATSAIGDPATPISTTDAPCCLRQVRLHYIGFLEGLELKGGLHLALGLALPFTEITGFAIATVVIALVPIFSFRCGSPGFGRGVNLGHKPPSRCHEVQTSQTVGSLVENGREIQSKTVSLLGNLFLRRAEINHFSAETEPKLPVHNKPRGFLL